MSLSMSLQRIAGSVLIIGSLLFLIAAFSPISRVFGEPDAAKKLEILMNGRIAWTVANILFALGAIVTAVGLALSSYQLRKIPYSELAYLGAAVIVVGAFLWSWSVYLRTNDPKAFVEGTLPGWQFIAYTILTQAGLVAFGIVLLRSGLPGWVGWMVIGGSLLFFSLYLIFKDMPPFVYYILTLVTGIMLFKTG